MKKKKWKQSKFLVATPLLLTSSVIITTSIVGCKRNSETKPKEIETWIPTMIPAFSLGWSNFEAKDKISELTPTYIFNNLDKFFSGKNNIKKESDISNVEAKILNDSIILTVNLKPDSWYNKDGQPGTISYSFRSRITYFKTANKKNETKTNNYGLPYNIFEERLGYKVFDDKEGLQSYIDKNINKEFIFWHIEDFITGSHAIGDYKKISNVKASAVVNHNDWENNLINLSFTLRAGTWYDSNGELTDKDKQFEVSIKGSYVIRTARRELLFPASNLIGWNNDDNLNQLDIVTEELIFNNFDKLFAGNYKINSKDDIKILSKKISEEDSNLIAMYINLKPGTWYDKNGKPGKDKGIYYLPIQI